MVGWLGHPPAGSAGLVAALLTKSRLYLKSAICTVWFRMRRVQTPIVACRGRLPVLYSQGHIKIGKMFSRRGPLLACELGARKGARLEIDNRVFINQGAVVVASSHIEIGDDSNHHSLDPVHPTRSAPVVIGRNVWLCRGAVVLPGSKIGDHTVVAAGSVVKGDLPSSVLAAGNPARVVRLLDIPAGWNRYETTPPGPGSQRSGLVNPIRLPH
jgi:acetyltransferase-like isoleucine patch superfamily enzyme